MIDQYLRTSEKVWQRGMRRIRILADAIYLVAAEFPRGTEWVKLPRGR